MVAYENLPMLKPPAVDWIGDTASEISSVDSQPAPVRPQRRTPRHRHGRTRTPADETDHVRLGRRGRRVSMRQYNENLLRQLKEVHDVELEDEDYVPGYSNRESALTTLMSDDVCMEEWYKNSMHECYEDDVHSKTMSPSTENKENDVAEQDDEDGRKAHPASVSSRAAYCRISWRLRKGLLRRRQLPTEEMDEVELALRKHFGWRADSRHAMAWSELLPPLRRLITHAVAEYLGLHSRSEDLATEVLRKKIWVSNPSPPFSPPRQQLTEYLSEQGRVHATITCQS